MTVAFAISNTNEYHYHCVPIAVNTFSYMPYHLDDHLICKFQVNQCLEDLISSIISWTNDRECINRTHLAVHNLSDHLPIFEQYTRLVQYVLTQRIAGLRASTKLLTVLLEVFRGLAQKVTQVVCFVSLQRA